MKKIYYILAAGLLSVTLNSCGEDWLNVQSHDKIYIDEYYNSEPRIKEALVAAYDPMQWFDWGMGMYNPVPMIYEVMADDIYPGGSGVSDNRHYHLMFDYSVDSQNTPASVWTICYSGVNRANCVHKYMPNVKGITDEAKAVYLAEATVLRNWYYTQMWKIWGNIPYYESNLDFPYECAQSKADEVYAAMEASLAEVIDSKVLPMKRTAEQGRVTQAAAMMLYAEIVMYQNDQAKMQKALDYMEEIITSGEYALVSSADLANMWEPAGEWSSETIFDINYFSQGAYRSWGSPLVAGGTVLPTLMGLNSMSGSAKYGNEGWGFFPLTPMAAKAFEEGDLRKAVTVYETASEPGMTFTARYQETGYHLAKYLPRLDGNAGQIADAVLNYGTNIRLYRYAETLLNAAELIAVHGCSGKGSADAYLNEVRTRAGLGNAGASLESILHERHVGLMGEGKRYWDLVRLGQATSVLTPANDEGGFRTKAWTENKKYLPFPQSEMDATASTQYPLTQNNY